MVLVVLVRQTSSNIICNSDFYNIYVSNLLDEPTIHRVKRQDNVEDFYVVSIAEFTQRVPLFLARAALRYQFRVNSQMVLMPTGLPN